MSDVKINAFQRIDAATYHSDPCPTPSLSSSIAKILIEESPMHAHLAHPRFGAHRWEPTAAMNDGTLIHSLMLGRGAPIVEIDVKNFKTKAAQEQRDAAEAAGKIPVTSPHLLHMRGVAATLISRLHKQFGITLFGESEVAAVWEETDVEIEAPVLCRGMLDHLIESRGVAYDIKTITSVHPDKCARQISDMGYDIQWAAYTSAIRTIRPDLAGREDFVFLFCEIEPPYCITPVRLNGEFRHLGQLRWRRAVRTWAECLKADRWPGYAEQIIDVEPTPWALAKELGNAA